MLMKKIKIIFLITGLNIGGAEMMLYKLLSYMDKNQFIIKVISLTNCGEMGSRLLDNNISVLSLGMKRGIPNPFFLYKLIKILKEERPDILQTWMYHADLIGFLAGRMAKIPKIIWGIRHSNLDFRKNKLLTLITAKICAFLSKNVNKIICCSEASLESHCKIGYYGSKMIVIPNGFNISEFKPNEGAAQKLKEELKIPSNNLLVGLVARWDPLKDHHNFIKAASLLKVRLPHVTFILCGGGISDENQVLSNWIKNSNCESSFYLLGNREDIARIIPGFDVLVSSSSGEGFPNVVGEAMSCEVPCVVTNVGDSAYIVDETGEVVPPRNPELLSNAIEKVLLLPEEVRKKLGELARMRVINNFEINKIVRKYEDLYLSEI
jgi:glycosyltransferase involved in cell wall biosynthesis